MKGLILQNASLQTNLRRLRAAAGLSQRELTSKMNLLGSTIDRNTYTKIELGTRNIKVTDLVALQQVYNVDFAEFFKGIEPHE